MASLKQNLAYGDIVLVGAHFVQVLLLFFLFFIFEAFCVML